MAEQSVALRAIEGGKVAREVAEAEFERFAEAMDLDVDASRMDADDLKSFDEVKATLLRAMEQGHLQIDEQGQPVYTPRSGGTPITFYEPTGATVIATDGKKKGQDAAKMIAMLADMTKQAQTVFAKMPMRDFKVCRNILQLFLG